MTDRTDAEKMAQLRERVASLELELEEQQYEIDDLMQRRDGLLEQVGKLKQQASAARSELNASYEARDVSRDRLISKMEKRQMESERARKALREDVEKVIAALVAAL